MITETQGEAAYWLVIAEFELDRMPTRVRQTASPKASVRP